MDHEFTSKELFSMYFSFQEKHERLKVIPFRSWRQHGTIIDPKQANTMLFLRKIKAIRYAEGTGVWEAEPSFFHFIKSMELNHFWTITLDSFTPDQCLHSYCVTEPLMGEHFTLKEMIKGAEYKYRILGTTDHQLYQTLFKRIYGPDINELTESSELRLGISVFWASWLRKYPETIHWLSHVYTRQELMAFADAQTDPYLESQFDQTDSWAVQFEIFAPFAEWEFRAVKWRVITKFNDHATGYFGSDQDPIMMRRYL